MNAFVGTDFVQGRTTAVQIGSDDMTKAIADRSAALENLVLKDQDKINREFAARTMRTLKYKRFIVRELRGALEDCIHDYEYVCDHDGVDCSANLGCPCQHYNYIYESDEEEYYSEMC
jgi:hypothetical protein